MAGLNSQNGVNSLSNSQENSQANKSPSLASVDFNQKSPSLAEGDLGGGLLKNSQTDKNLKNSLNLNLNSQENSNILLDKGVGNSQNAEFTHPQTPSAREGALSLDNATSQGKGALPLANATSQGKDSLNSMDCHDFANAKSRNDELNSQNTTQNAAQKSAPKLALVVPCYNEEAVIAQSYKVLNAKIQALISQHKIAQDSFICFVDDGSKDKTCEILLALKNGLNSPLGDSFAQSFHPASLRRMSNTPHSQGETIAQSNTANSIILEKNSQNTTQNSQENSQANKSPSLAEGDLGGGLLKNSQNDKNLKNSLNLKSNSQISQNDNFANAKSTHPQTPSAREGALNSAQNSNTPQNPSIPQNTPQNSATQATQATQTQAPHKVLKLSRNYGHQNALLAGLDFVKDKCDCVVSIDGDLQQDINAVDEMLASFQSGADIVYGVRKAYTHESTLKKYTSFAFYKLMQNMGVKMLYNHADYRLMSARAVCKLLEFGEVNLFLRGIVPLLGYKSAVVHYEQTARLAGQSKYPLGKMLSFAFDGITSFSVVPLRLMSILGVVLFGFAVIYGFYALYMRLFTDTPISGWTSTVLLLLFFGGVQFLGLGIMGEYIGKIYAEVKRRPRYIVESVL